MKDLKIDNLLSLPPETVNRAGNRGNPLEDFKKILGKAVERVNELLQRADEDTREMITGRKDVHQAMISIERAHISLRLMIQVRNKIISAYEEIMRMQL